MFCTLSSVCACLKSYAAVRVSAVPATPSKMSKATRPGRSSGNSDAMNAEPPLSRPAPSPPDDTRAAMSTSPTMSIAMYTAPIALCRLPYFGMNSLLKLGATSVRMSSSMKTPMAAVGYEYGCDMNPATRS